MDVGQSANIPIRCKGEDYDTKANYADLIYTSSNPSVAVVNTEGAVTAVSPGLAEISVNSCNDETHNLCVRVYEDGFVKYTNPTGRRLPVMGWYSLMPPYMTAERYREMAEAGFNISFSHVWSHEQNLAALEAAKGSGVKLLLSDLAGAQRSEESIRQMVNGYTGNEALAGYWLSDEPAVSATSSNAITVTESCKWNSIIRSIDRRSLTYLNLLPDYSSAKWWGTSTFADYIQRCFEGLNTNFISFDYYPIDKSSLRPSFYSCLENYRKYCERYAIPLWAFAMSTRHRTYPLPTAGHLRFEIYTALAFGAQGIQYFTYQAPSGTVEPFYEAPIDAEGNRTVIYDYAKEINAELSALSECFLGAFSAGRMFTGTTPPAMNKFAYNADKLPAGINSVSADGAGVLLSHLVNGANEYFMVVNRDFEGSQSVSIEFEGRLLRVLKDASITDAERNFTLEAGDMALFKLR